MINSPEEIAYNCLLELKKVLHAPLFSTFYAEDGTANNEPTEFGDKIMEIITEQIKKGLKDE